MSESLDSATLHLNLNRNVIKAHRCLNGHTQVYNRKASKIVSVFHINDMYEQHSNRNEEDNYLKLLFIDDENTDRSF